MKKMRIPARALCLALLAALLLWQATPARADQVTAQALEEILAYMDQTWLMPNGLDYNYMVANEPTDLAILLGLAILSQTPHLERDPSLNGAMNDLISEGFAYLDWLAGATQAPYDPWGNPMSSQTLREVYEVAITTDQFDQYSRDRYGVDPIPLVYNNLLTPIAQAHGGQYGGQPGPSGVYQPTDDDSGSIVLLGQEAGGVGMSLPEQTSPPVQQPAPDNTPLQEQDILGNWYDEGHGILLTFTQGDGPGQYIGRASNGDVLKVFETTPTAGNYICFEGHLYPKDDWDTSMTVYLKRDRQNRLVLEYNAGSWIGGPFIKN